MNAAAAPLMPDLDPRTAPNESAVPQGYFKELALTQLQESPTNPRQTFDEAAIDELALSIREKGVLQPILVRPVARKADRFEIVFGSRRFRAAKKAGLATIPSRVVELDDTQALEVQVVENSQRQDVHPLEEAHGYQQLMAKPGYDAARIAEKVGRSAKYVYERVKLLNLTEQAQRLFQGGTIGYGHAVVLSRLKPADQKRAIDTFDALFSSERVLFTPEEIKDTDDEPRKARTVRELQGWIDEHVKLDVKAPELPELFPETAAVLEQAQVLASGRPLEKVIHITHDHYVQPDAKDPSAQRVYGPMSWRRADGQAGSKFCEGAVVGVVVVGPGRGESFRVCIDKKGCAKHWGREQKLARERAAAATKGKTGEDRYELQRRKEEEQQKRDDVARARWRKALPHILNALAVALKKAPVKATGNLGDLLLDNLRGYGPKDPGAYVPRGKTAEDLVRHMGFICLSSNASEDWRAFSQFPKQGKAFGVDVAKILDEHAPIDEAPAAEAAPTKKAKKPAGPLARKAGR